MRLDIKHIAGNDLSADFTCTCPHPSFVGTSAETLMKRRIHLYGYNDDYFFNVVNKEPRRFKCNCGKEYQQQWFRDGYVEVEWIDNEDNDFLNEFQFKQAAFEEDEDDNSN